MNNNFSFKCPTRMEFGAGALKKLPEILRELQSKKIMLVTDPGVKNAGLLEKVEDIVKGSVPYVVYDNVSADPCTENIGEIYEYAKKESVDVFVAIGGGSAIDASKGASCLMRNGCPLEAYSGIDKVPNKGLPLIAIPTTAGTGSEFTLFAVLTDSSRGIKFTISSYNIMPDVAICDPELTLGMPARITAMTGMDALTHAVEEYTSKLATPVTDVLCLEAVRRIAHYLPIAVNNGSDITARSNVMFAAALAGIAMNDAYLGLSHAMASPLGAHFHIPHGMTNAVMLPYVVEYNYMAAPERYAELAEAMGMKTGNGLYEDAYAAVAAVKKIAGLCHIPPRLRDVGAVEDKLQDVARDALLSIQLKWNCRAVSEKQILEILKQAF